MEKRLYNALQVRFVKLRFSIVFSDDCILPKDKVSILRKGIESTLFRMNCICDRRCKACDFAAECIVQRAIYSRFEIKPDFATTSEHVGYLLECGNYQEDFKADEKLDFHLILFGKTIVYFHQFYQALTVLGKQEGIGPRHAKFHIIGIRNMEGMSVLKRKKIDMSEYVVHMLYDYIMFRKMWIGAISEKKEVVMTFDTPVILKHQSESLWKFQTEAMLSAIRQRIHLLNCFEGIESDILYPIEGASVPRTLYQEHHMVDVSRYSIQKNEEKTLKGLKGHMLLTGLTEDVLSLLLVGELIHLGIDTGSGFGKFHLEFVDN